MNLEGVAGWLLILAYLSLVVEMTVFAIPSEASALQLLTGDAATDGDRLAAARQRGFGPKLLRYLLPTVLGVALFVLPLAVTLWPPLRGLTLAVAEEHSLSVLLGLVLLLLGRLLTATAVLQLRRQLRRGRHDLQVGGVFGWSRNPILLGMYMFYLGNCLWLPSPLLWVGFALYIGNMHRRVLMEEGFLQARFGTPYRSYLARVPRYVGILRAAADTR